MVDYLETCLAEIRHIALLFLMGVPAFVGVLVPTWAGHTIVTFGDSTTAPRNVGASNNGRPEGLSSYGSTRTNAVNSPHNSFGLVDQDYPYLYVYSDILRDQLTQMSFNLEAVDNEGVGGNRTDQALVRLSDDVLSKSPQTVVVQFGLNDAAHDAGPGTASRVALNFDEQTGGDGILGNGNDHPYADRGNYVDNLAQIVNTFQSNGISTILMTPNQVNPSMLRNISRVEQYVQAARDVAESHGTSLVDVWQIYEDTIKGPVVLNNFLLDGLHPNGFGHQLVTNALIGKIVPEPNAIVLCLSGICLVILRKRRYWSVALHSTHSNQEHSLHSNAQ